MDAVYHEMREGIVGVGAVVIVLAVLEVGAIMTAIVLSRNNELV